MAPPALSAHFWISADDDARDHHHDGDQDLDRVGEDSKFSARFDTIMPLRALPDDQRAYHAGFL